MLERIMGNHKVNTRDLNLRPLWVWAQHHPGTLVVGALLVAALLAAPALRKSPPQADLAAEDVPLFI